MDEKKLRRYLGRLGDEAVPAPGFEDLSLQVLEVGTVPSNSRRGLVLAVAAAVVVLGGIGYVAQSSDGPEPIVAVGDISSATAVTAPTVTTSEYIRVELCEVDELVMLSGGSKRLPGAGAFGSANSEEPSIEVTVAFRNESVDVCVRPQSQSIRITDAAGNTHFSSDRSDGCDPLTLQCLIKPGETYSFGYILGPSSVLVGSLTSLNPGTYRALVTLISRLEIEAGREPVDPSMFDGVYERRTYTGEVTFEIPAEWVLASDTSSEYTRIELCEADEVLLLPDASVDIDLDAGVIRFKALFRNSSAEYCTGFRSHSFEIFDPEGTSLGSFSAVSNLDARNSTFILPGATHVVTGELRIGINTQSGSSYRLISGRYSVLVTVNSFASFDEDGEPLARDENGETSRQRSYSGEFFFEIP